MSRAVAACLVCLAAALPAFADEYASAPAAERLWIDVPDPDDDGDDLTDPVEVIGEKVGDDAADVTLPFSFPAFGRLYDEVTVSSNGWLSFGATDIVRPENVGLPTDVLERAFVAPLWDDLRTSKRGSVVTFVKGAAPNRTFVVAWLRMDTESRSRADVSFEALLHESSGVIEIAYERGVARFRGLSFTAGLQDPSGAFAFGAPNDGASNDALPAADWRFTPRAVTVTGTVLRDRPVASATGLGATTETDLPVRGARVEIRREDDDGLAAQGLTDEQGNFAITVLGIEGTPTLAVDLLAAGDESRVTAANEAAYERRVAEGVASREDASIGTVRIGAAADGTTPNFPRALNVQQAAREGFAFARAALASQAEPTRIPQVEIRWVPGLAIPSNYAPAAGSNPARISISDAPANPDPWDDDVVLREYAQHVLASLAAFPSGSIGHLWGGPAASESLGFADGFSFFFAAAVKGRGQFIDTTSATAANVFDLEAVTPASPTPPAAQQPPLGPGAGALAPGAVAASLWDMVDDADEAHDLLDGELPGAAHRIVRAIDQRAGASSLPPGAAAFTTSSFFDAWRAAAPGGEPALASRILIHHTTLDDDAREPDDVAAQPFGPASRIDALRLNAANTDLFTIPLAGEARRVAVSFPGATEATLELLDPAGTAVIASDAGASPLVVDADEDLPPGDYLVRLTHTLGPAATYAIAVVEPLRLVTTELAPTTFGQPFNQEIVVAGGRDPMSLVLTPALPDGLSIVTPGRRITGRALRAGTFDFDVEATDGSGSGAATLGTVRLVVNERLAMPDPFAVETSTQQQVFDVGVGGTLPTWNVTTPDPATGMVLTGGSSLRLSGTPGISPRSFLITGSAIDSVGATLATTTSNVVVAPPLGQARGTEVGAEPVGFAFDALDGASAFFDFGFRGSGGPPPDVVVVDARGTKLPLDGLVRRRGNRVSVSKLPIERGGKHFVVFVPREGSGFRGRLAAARGDVRPRTRVSGVVAIDDATRSAVAVFSAKAGWRISITVESGQAPVPALPSQAIAIAGPMPVGPLDVRLDRGGSRARASAIVLPADGEYTVTMTAADGTAGPLTYSIRIQPPR